MKAIVCGSCVVDLPCLTVDLSNPIGPDRIQPIEPIQPTGGGITCNVGFALQRLGIVTGVMTYVGDDRWGIILREQMVEEGLNTAMLYTHPSDPTTAVVALVDEQGARSFLAPGVKTATKSINAAFIRRDLPVIAQASYFILGYFGRMPALERDLPEVLQEIRATGCRTVMDSAGDGGNPERLQRILPHLDIYVPSEHEARRQTKESDPKSMLAHLRQWNPHGILGIKLGAHGAILESPDQGLVELPALDPGAPVVDTTGAGDCFLAGLIAGLDQRLPLAEAGRWAAAAGAAAVTQRGGHAGVRSLEQIQGLLD